LGFHGVTPLQTFKIPCDDLTPSYAIIRHNIRTFPSAAVLAVVKGRHKAESELKKFEDSQEYSGRHDGCRYFVEKSQVKPGTDPIEATQQRQAELEKRESKALRDTTTPIARSPNPPK
jgi:hypothetical protein